MSVFLHILSSKLNATGHRWVGELADFNFTIRYYPGRKNADADGLSRITARHQPVHGPVHGRGETGCYGGCGRDRATGGSNLPETTVVSQSAISLVQDTTPVSAGKSLSQGDIRGSQEQDAVIGRFLQHRANDYLPKGRALKAEPPEVRILLRQWRRLYVDDDGVIYRRANGRDQLLLPEEHREASCLEISIKRWDTWGWKELWG
ncbi:hypothetical protein L3Q82_004561 [Scortum barcoo]|uniref:Uncharacterized protein n=1 Tax=Scortum barcoo TaxID=214431 RepID=A0ACB8VHB6_9TELE|nr:hypothetical protein L3Q82_004561 [Scortum barcoo]